MNVKEKLKSTWNTIKSHPVYAISGSLFVILGMVLLILCDAANDILNDLSIIIGFIGVYASISAWINTNALRRGTDYKPPVIDPDARGKAAVAIDVGSGVTFGAMKAYLDTPDHAETLHEILKGNFNDDDDISDYTYEKASKCYCKDITADVMKDQGSEYFKIKRYRNSKDGKDPETGKYIFVECCNHLDEKHHVVADHLPACSKDFEKVLVQLSRYLGERGINELHIFYGGPLVMPFVIQDVFSNRFVVCTYHHAADGYMLVSRLNKDADAESASAEFKDAPDSAEL